METDLSICQFDFSCHCIVIDRRGHLGPIVQRIVSLMSFVMTNSLTVVAKVFSNKLIFLQEKCE